MAVKISKKAIVKYKVRPEESSVWMEACLESWDGGGTLDIQSDYGNFGYRWGATGCKDFRAFLCKLDRDYFFGKMSHADRDLFDPSATMKQMIKELIAARKIDRRASADIYRGVYDLITGIEHNVTCERSLYDYLSDGIQRLHYTLSESKSEIDDVVSECGLGDMSCLTVLTMTNPIHTKFWNELWIPLKEYWKQELQDEQPPEP
jgi:hypothetical protein